MLAAMDTSAPLHAVEAAPDLRFESATAFRLPAQAIVVPPSKGVTDWPAGSARIFGQLEVAGGGADGAVLDIEDQPDMGSYRFCIGREGTCHDLGLGVTGGKLHLISDADFYQIRQRSFIFQTRDYTAQRMEVSATLPSSGLQVHQEAVVHPPEGVPDCSDYPTDDSERFGCLMLGELLPEASARSDIATLRAALPDKMAQPKGNYQLVFAEEFSGDLDGDGSDPMCAHGFPRLTPEVLDPLVWSYQDNCDRVDSNNDPLYAVRDGHLELAMVRNSRPPELSSEGKVAFKYGYLEMKYTISLIRDIEYSNLATTLGEYYKPTWNSVHKYGVTIGNLEEFLTYTELEINFSEYVASSLRDVSHQYRNWHPVIYDEDIVPLRTNKDFLFCHANSGKPEAISLYLPDDGCSGPNATMTVIKGVEWTPRGYRTHYKVEGSSGAFQVLRKENIVVLVRPVTSDPGGEVEFEDGWRVVDRDSYFEFVDPADPDTVLEQAGVSHIPSALHFENHGWPSNANIRGFVKIDHVRVYQPVNRYADMEPVYQ